MVIKSKLLNRISGFALYEFFKREYISIVNDVSERSLCCRLAVSFENIMRELKFNGYYADSEYNRKQGGSIKTILLDEIVVTTITCDLIVHSRGESIQNDNLIAIEMAKQNKPFDDLQRDRKRLMALTRRSYDEIWSNDGTTHPEHVCGYVKGIYIIIDKDAKVATIESYANGAPSMPPYKISLNPQKNTPLNPRYSIRQQLLMRKKIVDKIFPGTSMVKINYAYGNL